MRIKTLLIVFSLLLFPLSFTSASGAIKPKASITSTKQSKSTISFKFKSNVKITNFVIKSVDTLTATPREDFKGSIVKTGTLTLKDLILTDDFTLELYSKKQLALSKKFKLDSLPILPADLKVNVLGENINILWGMTPEVPANNTREFEITYKQGSEKSQILKIPANQHIYTIKKINRKVPHTLSIVPVNNYGKGVAKVENIASFSPNSINNVAVKFTAPDKVNISWEYEGPGLESIKIKVISPNNKRNNEVVEFSGYAKSGEINGLTPGANYKFSLVASNKDGEAPAIESPSILLALAPDKVLDLKAVPGNTQVVLTWSAPTNNGGSPITGYILKYKVHTASDYIPVTLPVTPLSKTLTGLTNGTAYDFNIAAVNLAGTANASTDISATPGVLPAAPTTLTAVPADSSVTLNWVAPAVITGMPLTSYLLTITPTFSTYTAPITVPATVNSYNITGLSNGVSYTFKLNAVNSFGQSLLAASVVSIPVGTPGVPTAVLATPSASKVVLSWTAPTNTGGSAISGYDVKYKKTSDPDSSYLVLTANSTLTTTTATLTPLLNGVSYTFIVAAKTSAGKITGPYTSPITSTPFTIPNAPTGLNAAGALASVNLTWVAPAVDNGSPVSKYKVEYRLATATTWALASENVTGLSYSVTGLSPGSNYSFQVSAFNSAGFSLPTSIVNAVPITNPNGPATLTALPDSVNGGGKIVLNWTEGASNGGSVVTGYKVEYKLSSGGSYTVATPSTATLTYTLNGLNPGLSYDFQVSAINLAGLSAPRSVTATPLGQPDSVTSLNLTSGSSSLTINYSAPVNNGGSVITSYLVEYKTSLEANYTSVDNGLALSKSLTGLTDGQTYEVRVSAINKFGASSVVSASTLVASITSPPSFTSPVVGSSTATINWTLPGNTGGLPLTKITFRYKLTTDPAYTSVDLAPNVTSYDLTGLSPSTQYEIGICGVTSYGTSSYNNGSITTTA